MFLFKLDNIKLMKKKHTMPAFKYCILLLFAISLVVSCKRNHAKLSAADRALVKDSVTNMAANIAADISKNGPRAWLNYFEDSPDFFMANEGQLVFQDYQSSKTFILNTVVKNILQIKLRWEHLRIDPLTSRLASIGADFHEDQTNASGKNLSIDGYFTGIAHYDGHRWKLRNAHWSIKVPPVK
jgi:hypothetical protein